MILLQQCLALIPAYNEAKTIASVIHALQAAGIQQIRVVDNGSTDKTAIIARQAGAEVIFEPKRGYGQACWRGSQDLPDGVEWILFCDGDGSDDLSQLRQFFEQGDRYDLILGDRRAQGKAALTPVQYFGNALATHLIRWGWGYDYADLGPLRLIRRQALLAMEMADRGFGWTVEMQVKAIAQGLRICEIPVNYRPRQGGKSKISGTVRGSVQAGAIILSTLSKLYWRQGLGLGSLKTPRDRLWAWACSLLLIVGAGLMLPWGDFRVAGAGWGFGRGVAVMGVGFLLTARVRSLSILNFWLITILLRLMLLFMYPSDDIWRYLWEGRLQNLGFSPYEFAPDSPALSSFRTEWWSDINNVSVSAIYPPVAQWGFRFLAAIATQVWLFKLSFVLADLGICALLLGRWGAVKTIFYAWNPLILYSFAGGGHYDSWFLLPLVWAGLRMESVRQFRDRVAIALALGISIAIKWVSLPILGFYFVQSWREGQRLGRLAVLGAVAVLPLAIAAIPFCRLDACPLVPVSSSFVQKRFSAEALPYLLSRLGFPTADYRWMLGVLLLTVCGLLIWRRRSLWVFSEHYFFSLYLISPIIHAWYLSWIVPFSVASQNLGVRWLSVSAFVYFLLPLQQGKGDLNWFLSEPERLLLWMPLVVGWSMTAIASLRRG